MKGTLSKLGNKGGSCQYFKTFSPVEMITFIRLIMLNGLVLSMRFDHKFKNKEEDPETGNDLCTRMLGDNSNIQWKDLKSCFHWFIPESLNPRRKRYLIAKKRMY